VEDRPGEALAKVSRSIVKTRDVLTEAVSPHLTLSQLLTAARALAKLSRGAEAGRLVGAYDRLSRLPDGHFPHPVERESRVAAEAAVREVLSEEAYAEAHSSGGGLSVEEATTLVHEAPHR
jgi:hypothetical protein